MNEDFEMVEMEFKVERVTAEPCECKMCNCSWAFECCDECECLCDNTHDGFLLALNTEKEYKGQ